MKLHILAPFGFVAVLSLSTSTQAQGVPGGIAHGAAVGNQAAGPVGAVVGGAVGGVIGGVEGVLGIDPRPSYSVYQDDRYPKYRPHRPAKVGLRSSHRGTRRPTG